MKFILALSLLFFSAIVFGQKWLDLASETIEWFQQGKYENAIILSEKAAAEIKKEAGENNMPYIGILTIQATCYEKLFQYAKAELIYLRLTVIQKTTFGENSQAYTACLHNLAALYEKIGQYEKAEPLILQVLKIRKKVAGESDSSYSSALNGLALLYHSMGQYTKAEPLYIRDKEIKKTVYGEKNPHYALCLNNLSALYKEMGQYEKAELLLLQAKEINKEVMGENHPDYALNLNNLAALWADMDQYGKAETALLQVIAIRKKKLGETHPDYATTLNNLATLYSQLGDNKKAEPLIIKAVEIWRTVLGENSPEYAYGINNLAAVYRKTQTQYAKAELLYLEAVRLRKMILGENHPDYSNSQNDLALLYIQMGQYKKAEPLFLASSSILLQNIAGTFSILSEKEKGKYLDYNREIVECNNSYLYSNPKASLVIIENNYNLELGSKSLSLADTKNMLESIRNNKDTAVKRIFNQWMITKNILAKQYTIAAINRTADLKKLEAEAETLEKEMNRKSSAFSNQQKALQVTMKDVQHNLEEDEAAIEFIKFKLYNKKWTDSVIYGAYIVRKHDAAPQFVPLCEKKQLQQLFDSAGSTASRVVKNFYRGLDVKSKEAKLGTKLYKLIWEPLEPFLKNVKKISYSPAGKLYSVAFHALPVDSTTILMDKYELQQYTSTRQISLRTQNNATVKPGKIILFGDASFTMDSLQIVKQKKNNVPSDINAASSLVSKNRGNENGVWINLPGTAEEIRKIGQLFEQNKITTQSFVQQSASEDNFKNLTGKAFSIIHIATHGFFLPERGKKKNQESGQGNTYSLSADPLLRSGLVFAGGNYAWSGKAPVDGVEDGIATAYEISQLNLSNTELVVLSACETALGDVKGSEGVFGLQRAFKMAGVKKMIVSLWQVPDKETAELMTVFYSYWMKGKNINESFYQAQAEMRKKYPAYYWAAFVLVE